MILEAAFILYFGRMLAIAPAKPVFLVFMCIFKVGSLFCTVASSTNFPIFCRAVAGLGAAGLWVSIMSIIAPIKIGFGLSSRTLSSIHLEQIVIAQTIYADNEALVPQATSLATFTWLIGASVGLA